MGAPLDSHESIHWFPSEILWLCGICWGVTPTETNVQQSSCTFLQHSSFEAYFCLLTFPELQKGKLTVRFGIRNLKPLEKKSMWVSCWKGAFYGERYPKSLSKGGNQGDIPRAFLKVNLWLGFDDYQHIGSVVFFVQLI